MGLVTDLLVTALAVVARVLQRVLQVQGNLLVLHGQVDVHGLVEVVREVGTESFLLGRSLLQVLLLESQFGFSPQFALAPSLFLQ